MTRMIALLAALLSGSARFATAISRDSDLVTLAERTAYERTGRYDEVVRLCRNFERAYPIAVRCAQFGVTPEGRPMLALILSNDGLLDPAVTKSAGRPVIYVQGGIHAGEIDGKDAGFQLLKEMLEQRTLARSLSRFTLVFVPVLNVDGHERFGAYNRPNQNGPREMGWRVTAQNLNLNRDYAKADAPEMQAVLRLIASWDPVAHVDLHASDGAQFQHDAWIQLQPMLAGPAELMRLGTSVEAELMRKLTALRHAPLDFYPTLVDDDDPAKGFVNSVDPPRFSHGYMAFRNRLGILVETHSWKDYATRVATTKDVLASIFSIAERDALDWMRTERGVDLTMAALPGTQQELDYDVSGRSRPLQFLGYKYERIPSEISGALRLLYHPDQPQTWNVPFFEEMRATVVATAPAHGYLVSAADARWVAEKLRLHGIAFAVESRRSVEEFEVFRAEEAKLDPATSEGRTRLTVKGAWARESRELEAGSLYVPVAQPLGRLVMSLFEPNAPDSFLSWGFFNGHFEEKEHMENYVAEAVAPKMLEADPNLRREFAKRLADPAFANSPSKRLKFFYQRHPSWDERVNLYPVFRR